MGEVVNIDTLINKIEKAENELKAIKLELIKLRAKTLPVENIDKNTKKDFEKDIKEFVSKKIKTISGDETSKLLLSSINEK